MCTGVCTGVVTASGWLPAVVMCAWGCDQGLWLAISGRDYAGWLSLIRALMSFKTHVRQTAVFPELRKWTPLFTKLVCL